jgi:RNA polymerase sigma factor (sigma-70 family)
MPLGPPSTNPRSILDAARAGDRGAFEDLLAPFLLPAYKLAFTMLGQREAAEDAVQDAALKAWRAIGTLRAEFGDVRPWFLTILANECRSLRRRRLWGLPAATNHLETAPDPASLHIEARSAEAIDLRRSVAKLTHDRRVVLALVYWLDLPIDEVARVLAVSPEAARSRLRRAVLELRSQYTTEQDLDRPDQLTRSGPASVSHSEDSR